VKEATSSTLQLHLQYYCNSNNSFPIFCCTIL